LNFNMRKLTNRETEIRNALVEENYQYFLGLVKKLRLVIISIAIIFAIFQMWALSIVAIILIGLTFTAEKSDIRKIIEKKVDKEIEKYL